VSKQLTRFDASVLPELRELAAEIDPSYADVFATMPIDRWRAGADAVAELLLDQRIYLLHRQAGSRERRTSPRALLAKLNVASEIDLVAGLSVLLVASEHFGDEPREGG
jgi:hypothetical protein